MCRNITELRGLQPPATPVEIAAAARQYVRKVSGITHPSAATAEAFEAAVAEVTATTTRLLDALPPRRQPPTSWVQLPVTPTLAAPVHDEAALAEVAARVREAVG
ncbi:DUF2277 domain-containing protein [Mycobacterium tuberculosis]|uniref:DUF2277 domain-containing protein n=1 Tax=Mycobacterium tuberculosis TaxID=1773 RepID=UPI0005E88898|nr:DUF2277 family protein [Mycobacterium tuberculosis]CKP77886.1 Uncharacterized conserved protein [Mycobacterium tuberculosis]